MTRGLALLVLMVGCAKNTPVETADTTGVPPLDSPLPVDPGVRIGHLDNGVDYYIETNAKPAQRAVLRLVVDAGSVLESDDQRGLAHVVEHMAFNGTANFPGNGVVTYLESTGAAFGPHVNAYTSFDETVYMLEVPTSDPDSFAKAFQVLEDWSHALSFDAAEIEKERGVVLEEWRLGRGVGGRIQDAVLPLVYGPVYAGRDPIGTEASLKTFDPEALKRFYGDWYRPDLMTVVAVGDFDPEVVEKQIRDHFGPVAGAQPPKERARPAIPADPEPRYEVITDPELTDVGFQVFVRQDWKEGETHADYRDSLIEGLALQILAERFGVLAQQPEAPILHASIGPSEIADTKRVWVLSGSTREDGLVRGYEATLREVERARQHGFTQGELDRAVKNTLRSYEDYWRERDKTASSEHADEIVRVITTGESMPGIEHEVKLAKAWLPQVTLAEVGEVAKHFMEGDSRGTVVMMPKKDGLVAPTPDQLRAAEKAVLAEKIEAWAAAEVDGEPLVTPPTGGTIVSEERFDTLGFVKWTLSNGVEVWVKPTDFQADEVTFTAFSPGGVSLASDADLVSATTAVPLAAQSGLGRFDAVGLGQRLAGTNAGASPYVGLAFEGLTGGGSPDDLESILQLAYLTFTEPRFDQNVYDRDLASRTEQLRNRLADPSAVASDRYVEKLWQAHPRRSPWTVDDLKGMDLAKSQAFYEDRFADASDFTFVFGGNLDLEAFKPLVAQYLGGLPSTNRTETWKDDGARRAKGVHREVVKAGIDPQATVTITFPGEVESTWINRGRLIALADVLEVRLREELREELGGTYGVSVGVQIEDIPVDAYALTVRFACDPARADELEKRAFEVIEELRKAPVDAHYIEDEKRKGLREREEAEKSNGFWVESVASALQRGEDPADILRYAERMSTLTPELVHKAAQDWLHADGYVAVVLLPAETAKAP